ncbi:MAG: fasciclin domain-containing protein [Ilumatobacteraceae bacterium]
MIVQVSSPEGQLKDLELIAEQFNYAAAMLRLFSREREGLRAEVGTLFVPLDTALASSLASQERTLADLNSPSRYNVLLLRAHASSVRLTLTDLASAVGQKILLLSGTEVTVVADPTSGALNLVRSDGTQVKIVANDVFTGDLVVHFVDQPVSLPFGA